jgi:hypothetical protein
MDVYLVRRYAHKNLGPKVSVSCSSASSNSNIDEDEQSLHGEAKEGNYWGCGGGEGRHESTKATARNT